MNIVVFGSRGGIGSQVVEQALAAGHQVTAVVHNVPANGRQHENLEWVRGDVLKPDTIQDVFSGQAAVVSALGVHNRAPTSVYSQGVANIIRAMQAAGVRRLLCVSASGLEPGPTWQRWIAKPILWAILKEMYTDLVRMEAVVERSPLDWTILRPPRLTDGPRTGQYQVALNKHLSRGSVLSRPDLADYIVRHLADPASYCAIVETAY